MTYGALLMQVWHVANLDSPNLVSIHHMQLVLFGSLIIFCITQVPLHILMPILGKALSTWTMFLALGLRTPFSVVLMILSHTLQPDLTSE